MLSILNGIKVGVQSWCFRGFKENSEVVKALKECGLDTIELCGVHINVDNSMDVDEVLKLYKNNGISLNSYGIERFPNDETKVRPIFELAKKSGITALGADPDPEAFDLLENLCREYSVRLAIHNHGRNHRYGSTAQLENVFKKTSQNIGLCMDTAWMLDAGEDPVKAVKKFSGRLYGIHFKDFTFKEDGSPEDVILGMGGLKLKDLADALKEAEFRGYASIEYEGDVADPVPSIKKCIEELKKTFFCRKHGIQVI